ncbi:MAG: amidase family protein [Fervidicoccaceae archaeon]
MALLERSLANIKRLDPQINAFITIDGSALEDPPRVRGPLLGVPIALKDNIATMGLRTTCASRVLEDFVPSYDATVTKRLKASGAIVIGKTNMDEFAMGALGTTSAFGPTRNPLDLSLSPGGSSSGSAAAVASGMVPVALGSDTGGSIRLPAAWTLTFGLKPTFGLVSRYGLVSYGESLEQIGPMAANAKDLALLMSVIAGRDSRDATSLDADLKAEFLKVAFSEPSPDALEGLRLAVIRELVEHPQADEDVIRGFWKALDELSSEGVKIDVVECPLVLKAPQIYYVIAFSEASSNLARYTGVLFGKRVVPLEGSSWDKVYSRTRALFGWEVRRRIILGAFVLSKGYYDMYFSRALRARSLLARKIAEILARYDAIVSPGSPVRPLPLDFDVTDLSKLNAVDAPLVVANLSGLPAISFPIGLSRGAPISMQLIGPRLSDPRLLEIAKCLTELVYKSAKRWSQ